MMIHVRSSYACENCHLQFISYSSLLMHKQSYCYKRNKLPRSSTITSETAELSESRKHRVSSEVLQDSDTRKEFDVVQLMEIEPTSYKYFKRGFENVMNSVPLEYSERPSKRKKSELVLVKAPTIQDTGTLVPEYADREFSLYANSFGMSVQDLGLAAFYEPSFYSIEGITGNEYIIEDSSPQTQPFGLECQSALGMLTYFANQKMQEL